MYTNASLFYIIVVICLSGIQTYSIVAFAYRNWKYIDLSRSLDQMYFDFRCLPWRVWLKWIMSDDVLKQEKLFYCSISLMSPFEESQKNQIRFTDIWWIPNISKVQNIMVIDTYANLRVTVYYIDIVSILLDAYLFSHNVT